MMMMMEIVPSWEIKAMKFKKNELEFFWGVGLVDCTQVTTILILLFLVDSWSGFGSSMLTTVKKNTQFCNWFIIVVNSILNIRR